jgi:hypothetical protein
MSEPLPPLTAEERQRIAEFAVKAEAYCDLLVNHEAYSLTEFAIQCSQLLAWLYQAAYGLRDIETCYGMPNQTDGKEELNLSKEVFYGLRAKFGVYEQYFSLFNPYEPEVSEPTLLDDSWDINVELRSGLSCFQKGEDCDLRQAVWYWWNMCHVHWGEHVVMALPALRKIVVDKLFEDSIEENEAASDD